MSSRLFQRVREELGLAYSVYTYQSFHADTGVQGVYIGTAPDSASAATDAIRSELRTLAENGIPDAELAAGKSQLKGQITADARRNSRKSFPSSKTRTGSPNRKFVACEITANYWRYATPGSGKSSKRASPHC